MLFHSRFNVKYIFCLSRIPNRCLRTFARMTRPFVIGISGVTNGGKTTLVYKLKQKFPGCPVIHQDEFFLPPNHAGLHTDPELGHANWDELAALDMEKMMNVVQKSINDPGTYHSQDGTPPLIFVEGFLLYNYRPLAEVFDKKYFLTLPKEECFKRRCKRRYHPPDPPGYFEKICWPMYLKNKAELKDQEDIVYLDGMDNQWMHFDLVYEDIQELAKKIEVA
ncbi:nicotinamide riboside kinase 1 [Lingula anatina]|uniref:Nicotinamide riboside kinase 1 n=1 Tax=Lingula anatina TaxID=7574 RepID=A0A1S3IY49_LINAN|nr:nicotinamide riboside kinase 1 [Lingula anatina]|eukprot:XP_013403120.1 nicotinamide riboside kinase 1 [Lingula anatina]